MKSCLYAGSLRHRRLSPQPHAFRYGLFMAYLDLAELDDVFRGRWFWSARRPALARFRRDDYLGPARLPLDEAVLDVIGGSLRLGSLSVLLPDGRERTYRGAAPGPDARLEVRDWRGVRGIVREGSIGLAEGWMAEELDTPDLPTLIELAAHHLEPENRRVPEAVDRLGKAAWRAIGRAGRLRGPLRTMAEHYDLGNRFFSLWLDETMTYSSAYFARDDMTLAEAQREKYRRLAERAAIAPGMRVLETGCGWGSFAVYLATELGCTVTTTTISREQAEHVKTRVGDLGLGDRIQVLLEDFADTTGRFDAIVSVEMIESIPGARWPAYFRALRDRLEPGGVGRRAGDRLVDALEVPGVLLPDEHGGEPADAPIHESPPRCRAAVPTALYGHRHPPRRDTRRSRHAGPLQPGRRTHRIDPHAHRSG